MSAEEDLGPIVVDPHAFESLWPALAIWLLLFVTAGDAWTITRRAVALAFGRPARAVVEDKRRLPLPGLGRYRRDYVFLSWEGGKSREAVGTSGWRRVKAGETRPVHVLGRSAFLDDDFGYTRWKAALFGAALILLWLWAAARYRFG